MEIGWGVWRKNVTSIRGALQRGTLVFYCMLKRGGLFVIGRAVVVVVVMFTHPK